MAHALGAQVWVDLVNLDALVNGFVGAFGLAYITIDAFGGDSQCHCLCSFNMIIANPVEGALTTHQPELFLERNLDFRPDKLGYIAIETGYFPYQRRGNKTVSFIGCEKHRFDL